MKLNEAIVGSGYEDLLTFENVNDEDKHNATMIMFKFLSIIEESTKDKISRKKLAELIGTSPSNITQLFRGNRLINLLTLAKFERVLDLEFEVKLKSDIENDIEAPSYSMSLKWVAPISTSKTQIDNNDEVEFGENSSNFLISNSPKTLKKQA